MAESDTKLLDLAMEALGVSDLGQIGAPGGQKQVRAVSDEHGRRMVLKVITLNPSTPDALRRAEREVELLSALSSEHVVKVASELAELGDPVVGAAWLEEYLDGEDLTAHLSEQWNWDETREMGVQVADGLAAAHAVGVVHRDLSSNNVRRLNSGVYKVMDFGFARHTLRSGLTVAGQPGTPGFLTPEHLNAYSGGPMPASDVFAVGNLMYMALTGHFAIPHLGDDDDYIRRVSSVQLVEPIADARAEIGPARLAVVQRCMHPQPARRYRNGAELRDVLEAMK